MFLERQPIWEERVVVSAMVEMRLVRMVLLYHWSIEVDTYYNGGYDPTDEDHVMFTFDGDVDDPAVGCIARDGRYRLAYDGSPSPEALCPSYY